MRALALAVLALGLVVVLLAAIGPPGTDWRIASRKSRRR